MLEPSHLAFGVPAGKVLLREGTRALDAVAEAARRNQRAGVDARLVLAMKAGTITGILNQIIHSFGSARSRHRIRNHH
jgi:hypothetical protein